MFNEIYSHYINDEDIYLGDLENPNDSHGIVIADELRKKAIREQIARKRLEALNHA